MSVEEQNKNKLKPSNITVGTTVKGQKIEKIFFYDDEKNYIIFQNDSEEVKYFGNLQVSEITPYLGECNYLREMSHGNKIRKWIDYQKASAMNEFFLGQQEKSIEILNKCMEVVKVKEVARKKMVYIGMYLSITILLFVVSLVIKIFFPRFEYIEYLYIALFGAFGGFISLNSKLEKVDFCISENTYSYIVVSIYKMAFACISSIISYLLIQSDMILSAVKDSYGIVYIVATVAGFSEQLIPNIFDKIENDSVEKD